MHPAESDMDFAGAGFAQDCCAEHFEPQTDPSLKDAVQLFLRGAEHGFPDLEPRNFRLYIAVL